MKTLKNPVMTFLPKDTIVMKKSIYLLFILLLAACSEKSNPIIEQQLHQLLEAKDIFRLETLLEKEQPQLSKSSFLYFEACLHNAFNRTEQSLQNVDMLLDKYKKSLNDTILREIYTLKFDNCLKQNRYKEAVEALKIALYQYGHVADSTEFSDTQENYNAIEPFKNLPPQKIQLTKDVVIPVVRNQFNHLMMQVTCGGQSDDFIFDTGAMLSVVSESCAQQMNIRVLESSAQVGNSVGGKVTSKVGYADSLRIGDLLVENVAFLIIPDEMLSFPEINYAIHGIVGFPVMYQMKEIRIHRDGSITVPVSPVKLGLHNMFLEGLSPVIRAGVDSDTLLFVMDTGANTSGFSGKYFDAHKNEILEKAALKKVRIGGDRKSVV
jgi:predicted aspartyl protease